MIEQAKGTTNTVRLGLGQQSACPGPPQYQKNQLQYDVYPHQQQQQQQQACCNTHAQQQSHPHPHFYHPYNQVPPQQPRLPTPQQASVTQQPQQPLQMPLQQQQNHHQHQLPSQPLPQQFPQHQPSLSQHQQPQHHHLQHQQNHHEHQHTSLHQHHHQQQQQQQSTSHNTTSHHPHHQPSTSHTPAHENQTQMAPSPAALKQHPHPTAQDVAALKEEKARLEAHLREMRDRRRCVVCLDKDQGAVFMPCSHLVTCPPCAVTLTTCPVCRTPVQYLVPVILD